jgi:hypothetical protein
MSKTAACATRRVRHRRWTTDDIRGARSIGHRASGEPTHGGEAERTVDQPDRISLEIAEPIVAVTR